MKKAKKRERRGAYERDFSIEKNRDVFDGTFEGGSGANKLSRKGQKDHNRKD